VGVDGKLDEQTEVHNEADVQYRTLGNADEIQAGARESAGASSYVSKIEQSDMQHADHHNKKNLSVEEHT